MLTVFSSKCVDHLERVCHLPIMCRLGLLHSRGLRAAGPVEVCITLVIQTQGKVGLHEKNIHMIRQHIESLVKTDVQFRKLTAAASCSSRWYAYVSDRDGMCTPGCSRDACWIQQRVRGWYQARYPRKSTLTWTCQLCGSIRSSSSASSSHRSTYCFTLCTHLAVQD